MIDLRRTLFATPCLLALGAAAGTAHGAAFQLQEQSASLLGSAFAGRSADAYDISHLFFNPATLGRQVGRTAEAEVVLSYLRPTFDFKAEGAPDWSTIGGNPVGGDAGRTRAGGGEDAFVPAFYAGFDLRPDLRAGLGINAPYGMETDYPEDWVGRYDAVNTDLLTVDLNPAIGWQVNERLSLGFGLSAQYADATLSSMVPLTPSNVPAGLNCAALGGCLNPASDGKLEVSGDSWAYGFNLGALFELTPATRVGIAYRHGMSHTLSGKADFTQPATGNQVDTGGEAELNIPATLHVGLSQQLTPQWTLLADATWTEWSDFDELAIAFDDDIGLGDEVVDEYDWDDTWLTSLGARYDHNERWDLRAGVAYDQTPTSDRYRTPRIPDGDRTWIAVGATWYPYGDPDMSVDFGYTYIWLDDANITLAEELGLDVEGQYRSNVQVLTASTSWRF